MISALEAIAPVQIKVRRRIRASSLVCGGLLLIALVVRLTGLTADLPYIHHPDEPVNLRVFDGMVEHGDPNPHFFNYPSLFFYLHAALHFDGPLLSWVPGLTEQAPITAVMGVTYAPTVGSVLFHRILTVVLGVLLVLVTWCTARRISAGMFPALMAALLLALSPTLITHSRFITPDMLVALLVALTLLAAVRLLYSGSWRTFAISGIAIGLATSAKYTAVLVVVPVVLAALLRSTERAELRRTAAGLPLTAGCAVLAFLATTPYALLDRVAFLRDLQFERNHYATGHFGMDGDAPRFYAEYLLSKEGLLVTLAVAAVVVVAVSAREKWRVATVLASFPIAYGMAVALQTVRNDRTIMLILPPLAVLAALAVEPVADWARNHQMIGFAALSAAVAVLVIGMAATFPQSGPSTWTAAQRWLDEHTTPGTAVLIEAYSPWLDPARYQVTACDRVIDCPQPPGGYVVASEGMYGRFIEAPQAYPADTAAYERLFRELPEVATFDDRTGPIIRIFKVPAP